MLVRLYQGIAGLTHEPLGLPHSGADNSATGQGNPGWLPPFMETQMDPDPAGRPAPRMPACCLFLAPARWSLPA
ncbi:hypothetical protein KMM349_21830 [Stenotrophomonas maltophilia]|nr:hypothetical protein KMM349_21830 [Stenotrophomonas maltophilia]